MSKVKIWARSVDGHDYHLPAIRVRVRGDIQELEVEPWQARMLHGDCRVVAFDKPPKRQPPPPPQPSPKAEPTVPPRPKKKRRNQSRDAREQRSFDKPPKRRSGE